MIYLLDANVFIQAKNLHYGLDFCPACWEWLIEKHCTGKIFSIDKVAIELEKGEDELTEWANKLNSAFFRNTDNTVLPYFGKVGEWVTNQNYEQMAINAFMQVADYYLLAHALSGEYTVVTHEVPAYSTKKVKIPNGCAGLNIKCMTPYQMLRQKKARFVLGRV